MNFYDEGTGIVLLIVILLLVVGYLIYLLVVGASYVLVAILAVLYTIAAVLGGLALAGLDMLLCPAGLPIPPWAAWTAWGALCGASAGFWTVAPVYGMRGLRRVILAAPLAAAVIVAGIALVLSPQAARLPQQPAPAQAQATYQAAIPIRFEGIYTPAKHPEAIEFALSVRGEESGCPNSSTVPLAGSPVAESPTVPEYGSATPDTGQAPRPEYVAVKLANQFEPAYTGELLLAVRMQPSTLGYAESTTYWPQSERSGGYLIWFLDQELRRVLFLLIVEPNGTHRFVDHSVWGTGPMQDSPREYMLARRTGMMGLGRRQQHLKVDWVPRGFRRDDGMAVSSQYMGMSHYIFPEGDLLIEVTPPATAQ